MNYIEMADQFGLVPLDLEKLFHGRATTNLAERLGVTQADIEGFLQGVASEALAQRMGAMRTAAQNLADEAGDRGRLWFVLGMLV